MPVHIARVPVCSTVVESNPSIPTQNATAGGTVEELGGHVIAGCTHDPFTWVTDSLVALIAYPAQLADAHALTAFTPDSLAGDNEIVAREGAAAAKLAVDGRPANKNRTSEITANDANLLLSRKIMA